MNIRACIHGVIAAASGGAVAVLQHWVTEGEFDFSPQHLKAAAMGAIVAVLLYLAKSPISSEVAPNGQGETK
jgi:hypothetical protein